MRRRDYACDRRVGLRIDRVVSPQGSAKGASALLRESASCGLQGLDPVAGDHAFASNAMDGSDRNRPAVAAQNRVDGAGAGNWPHGPLIASGKSAEVQTIAVTAVSVTAKSVDAAEWIG